MTAHIILGAAGEKGLPVAGQSLGRDRVEPQEIVVHQREPYPLSFLLFHLLQIRITSRERSHLSIIRRSVS